MRGFALHEQKQLDLATFGDFGTVLPNISLFNTISIPKNGGDFTHHFDFGAETGGGCKNGGFQEHDMEDEKFPPSKNSTKKITTTCLRPMQAQPE